jgi:glycosyltransferase involved in cell wall biosynthesis
LLVVGDPWESYWSAFFLNKFLRLDIPIQIQIHGDIGNPNWYRMSLVNYLRFNLAKLSIPRASAVRCVGHSQAKFVLNKFNIRKELLSVIPIPISTKLSTASSNSKKVLTLGLVGRIDRDRGIKNFLQLIKCLQTVRQDFSVMVIGTGPELLNLKKDLGELLPAVRVIFLGELPARSLQLIWPKINVLISMAQSESYGRAMREALVAGVPVWATKSSGVEDLISKAGENAVKILDLTKNSHELSKELDQLLKCKVSLSFRKQFIKDNSTYAQLLAKSWVDLINKQKL